MYVVWHHCGACIAFRSAEVTSCSGLVLPVLHIGTYAVLACCESAVVIVCLLWLQNLAGYYLSGPTCLVTDSGLSRRLWCPVHMYASVMYQGSMTTPRRNEFDIDTV